MIQLIIRDKKSRQTWKTPKHSNDKRKDDYHSEVKKDILKGISKDIIKQIGRNGDVEIIDGKIWIRSTKYDKTGKRVKKSVETGISAEEFFVLTLTTILRVLFSYPKVSYSSKLVKTKNGIYRIYLEITISNKR